MFLIAAVHGIFSIIQFHTAGNVSPIYSLFTSNLQYSSLANFPFQVLGFFALVILFLMAATSHDFWLKNLSPRIWKSLHMMVYVAYFLIIMHVMLGAYQEESSTALVILLGIGMVSVVSLHLMAGFREVGKDKEVSAILEDEYVEVGDLNEIGNNKAKIVRVNGEPIAIFKYDGKLSAVSNVCRHQHGPLGEGKIVDGCITCPWHGYQYLPHNGTSPPPFTEKVETYDLRLEGTKIWVHPKAHPPGTEITPISISTEPGERIS
jgi:nitrite reductase/ring-hydroxylating ferredoxin subunit